MSLTPENYSRANLVFGDVETDGMNNLNVSIKYKRNGKEGPVNLNPPLLRTNNEGVITRVQESGGSSHSVKVLFPRKRPVFVEDKDEEGNVIGGHYEEPDTVMEYPKILSDPNDPNSELVPDESAEKVEVPNDYVEAQAYATIIDDIYEAAVDHCFANKNRLGFQGAKQRLMVEAQLKKPVYRRAISEDNEDEDMSVPPSIYLKFIESGPKAKQNPNTVYTKFTGVDQKPIHWTTLQNTMMYLLPQMRIERIFLGAKKNIQCKMPSAIVTETKAREEMSQDKKVIDRIIEENPAALQAFLKNLGLLEKYREVKRESDTSKKTIVKPAEIKAQPPPEANGKEDEEEEEEEETDPVPPSGNSTPSRKNTALSGKDDSPLSNYMAKSTSIKKVITRNTSKS